MYLLTQKSLTLSDFHCKYLCRSRRCVSGAGGGGETNECCGSVGCFRSPDPYPGCCPWKQKHSESNTFYLHAHLHSTPPFSNHFVQKVFLDVLTGVTSPKHQALRKLNIS